MSEIKKYSVNSPETTFKKRRVGKREPNASGMQTGVIFPTREIGNDITKIKDYAQAVEDMGYSFLLTYDHVLGAHVPAGNNDYTNGDAFHEPFTLFSYLAGCTDEIRMIPGTMVLPQRQTALVAKQAAMVDVYTNGRLDLGIGVGTNEFEFEALGENPRDRGQRIEEQVDVLRRLWTQDHVVFDGKWHTLNNVGINPRPIQQPIPIWMGGWSDKVMDRTARIADGWAPMDHPDTMAPKIEEFRRMLEKHGRDPEKFPIMGAYGRRNGRTSGTNVDELQESVQKWKALEVPLVAFGTMSFGFKTLDEHLDLLERHKEMFDAQ